VAAVGVEDHAGIGVPGGDRVGQRGGDQLGAQVIGQGVPDDAAGGDVDHGGHSVESSFVGVHRILVTWESSQVRAVTPLKVPDSSDST
jgi:hypothetical protein